MLTYERPAGLVRCLEALARLDPTPGGFEVVVIDDGSREDPARLVEPFAGRLSIRHRRFAHAGVAAARNRGLEASTAPYVGFIADDYVLPRDYLQRARAFLDRVPDAEVVTFNLRSCGASPARHVQDLYFQLALRGNAGSGPDEHGVIRSFALPASRAAIFRREVFARVGPFDETMLGGEDGEMSARLAKHGIAQHFLTDVFIEHWEDKSLGDFLRQRRDYATSFYELWRRRQPAGPLPSRWTLAACLGEITARLQGWLAVSRQIGCVPRFVALAPGLTLFLAAFYLTLYRCHRADLGRSAQGAPRSSG